MEKDIIRKEVKDELKKLADAKYKEFHSGLCPNVDTILGVRVPVLRNYAKNLLKTYNISLLQENIDDEYYEEIMLKGMLIGLEKKLSKEEFFNYISDFIPKIDNWAVCDTFCAGLKMTKKYEEEMWNYIQKYLLSDKEFENRFAIVMILEYFINDKYIKALLNQIFMKNDFVLQNLKKHSAARTLHHGYLGGLLEHTLSVTEICDFMSGRYKKVNRDILICTAMLHDIGKIYELSQFPVNEYTDDGQLLGHIFIGAEMVHDAASKIEGFPKNLESLIKHSILAHHGEYEYGSPELPKTIEAFILHCADNMDAKVKAFEEAVESGSNQGNWIGYNKMLQRNIRKTDY